jgi:hypothetical protein
VIYLFRPKVRFLSETGDFFLKVHRSKSCVAILKLKKVQGRLLRKSRNLELDRASTSCLWLRYRRIIVPVRYAF